MSYKEVSLGNGVFDLRNPSEISAEAFVKPPKGATCPYSWVWDVLVLENGDVVVNLTEVNRVQHKKLNAVVARYGAEEIIAELEAHWRRPTFAHCAAEGKLARHCDQLRNTLERIYASQYAEICRLSAEKHPNRVAETPDGLLESRLCKGKDGVADLKVYRTDLHPHLVASIAWATALLAVFAQGCQYDLPYGGLVYDTSRLLREATRDI